MLAPAPGDTLADAIAKTARAIDPTEPLEFIRHLADDDIYHRGPAPGGSVFVIMGIWSGMPADLLAAVRARRTCSVTGRCPLCGTCLALAAGEYAHEAGCPVSTEILGAMMCRWLVAVGRYARGRRIREDPT